MANIWTFVFVGVGSLILGAVLAFVFIWLHDKLMQRRAKKKIPTKEDGSYDLKAMEDGGKAQINEKEVIEDERNKHDRFREYEKLRHLATQRAAKGASKPAPARRGEISANEQSSIRRAVSPNEHGDDAEDDDDIRLH